MDPKFLDPKYVFSELDITTTNKINIFHPEKQKKPKAEGYPENDYTLYHKLSAKEFIACENAVEALQSASEIVIDDEAIDKHEKTTREIRESCKDIKVLGRKDLRMILKWWKALKEAQSEGKKEEDGLAHEDETVPAAISLEEQEDLEDVEIENQIAELRDTEAKELKRKKKKVHKERQKLNERLNLKMVHKGDEGPKLEEDDMFSLNRIQTHQQLEQVTNQTPDIVAESEEDSNDEGDKPKTVRYQKDMGHLDSKGLYYKSEDSDDNDSDVTSDDDANSKKSGLGIIFLILIFKLCFLSAFFKKNFSLYRRILSRIFLGYSLNLQDKLYSYLYEIGLEDSEDESTKKPKSKKKQKFNGSTDNPLLTDLDFRDKKDKEIYKAELWFDKDAFKNLENEDDEDYELDKMVELYKNKGKRILGEEEKVENYNKNKKEKREDNASSEDESNSDYDVEKIIKSDKKSKKVGGKDGFEIVSREKGKLLVENYIINTLIITNNQQLCYLKHLLLIN